jgi:hypothetical protein
MKKFYTIKENYAEILLQKDIYPLVVVKKTLTNFMKESYIKINSDNDKIIIQIILQKSNENLEKMIGNLYNELLRESLRYDIALETKNLRELIVGRALYTTCIDLEGDHEEENNDIEDEIYRLDEIAVNWFDKYGDKEEHKC